MNRAIVTAILFLGSTLAAQAGESFYTDMSNRGRGDRALQLSADLCAHKLGMSQDAAEASPRFNRCMLTNGWQFEAAQGYSQARSSREDADAQDDADAQEALDQSNMDDEWRRNNDAAAQANDSWIEDQENAAIEANDEAAQAAANQETSDAGAQSALDAANSVPPVQPMN
jgi:hypothetical protein